MAKFKIVLKLTGLELEIEGSREDIPLITQNVTQQFAGLLKPATNIVEGENGNENQPAQAVPTVTSERPKIKKRRAISTGTSDSPESSIDWVHDPAKWGGPRQEWSTVKKAIWLLYVASKEANKTELSASEIANTFNKHFRQSGLIRIGNVGRDLGAQKTGKDATVSENTTSTPYRWFLTEKGLRLAEQYIAESKGEASPV